MQKNNTSTLDSDRYRYEYIAHQINREDTLVNYRLTWTLQANGFLFAALALVGKDLDGPVRAVFDLALPLTGLSVSMAGILGVYAANRQITYLISLWSERPFLNWPRPFGGKWAFGLGTLPAYIPLVVFAFVWSAVLIWPHVTSVPPKPRPTVAPMSPAASTAPPAAGPASLSRSASEKGSNRAP